MTNTDVRAVRNMGIQVWMLGKGRAIPRNYRHLLINEAQVDWFTGQNYNEAAAVAAWKETLTWFDKYLKA